MKKIYVSFFLIILTILCTLCGDVFGWGAANDSVQITISENDNLSVLSERLKKEDVIISKHLFRLFYQWNTHSSTIHPGMITVHKNDSYQQISKIISDSSKGTVTITIPEGFEVREIAARLSNNEIIASEEEFYNTLNSYSFETNQGDVISGNSR